MKNHLIIASAALAAVSTAPAFQGLYSVGSEAQESIPLTWNVGATLTYDDNVTPLAPGPDDEVLSINPFVSAAFVNIQPQDTLDVYARLGALYYFDEPSAVGSDEIYAQARLGINYTRRFTERLRFSTRNFVAYELEPDYAHGFATSRQQGEYLYWQTDNSIGFRWTERFATYTGFSLTGLDYQDVENLDRFTYTLYNQFRYQLSEQTVATFDYRYADTDADGLATDSSSHYFLLGAEHRFSPNTILVAKAGAQLEDSDRGDDGDFSPFVEASLRSQINQQFSLRGFVRYSSEVYDTVRLVDGLPYEYEDRGTLRIGLSAEYGLSPRLSLFGGVNYIPSTFEDGTLRVDGLEGSTGDRDEDLLNAYVGLSWRFMQNVYGTLSYNYTDVDSEFASRSYDRNRVSVGVRAEF